MPDANKLLKLTEIGYVVQCCCRLCRHGRFRPSFDFGQCAVHTYEHQKHTGGPRPLTVHQAGVCPQFEINVKKKANLEQGGFLPLWNPLQESE